jgi:hypothetical protein
MAGRLEKTVSRETAGNAVSRETLGGRPENGNLQNNPMH